MCIRNNGNRLPLQSILIRGQLVTVHSGSKSRVDCLKKMSVKTTLM